MDSMIGNLREIDIKRLRVFMRIVECGGFVQAQNELNMSASTISLRMSELEDRLGLRLCQRGRAGFSMTSEGNAVYQACQTLLAAHENFNSAVGAAKGIISGELRLGVIDNAIFDPDLPVSKALARFNEQVETPEISLYTMTPSDLQRAILDQRLHLAIGVFYDKIPTIDYQVLCKEKLLLYCGREHPFSQRDTQDISREEILTCDYIERTYGLTASRLNKPLPLVPSAFSSSLEATALLILSGKYIGFLPGYYANIWCSKGLMTALAEDKVFVESEVCLATHKTAGKNLTTMKLTDLFIDCFNQRS